ncbi:MAG: VCBS repeat-containing protein [Planctomycetota bacterium]
MHRRATLPTLLLLAAGAPAAAQEFSSAKSLASRSSGAEAALAADLDGDGDRDVVSISRFDGTCAWYENVDGEGTFEPRQFLTTEAALPLGVFAADLDGDFDADVLLADFELDRVSWFENTDGAGAFGPERVFGADIDGVHAVAAEDLDGDGDLDVVCTSALDGAVIWYANLDGLGTFGAKQLVAGQAQGAAAVAAADLDGDGDADVLSSSASGVGLVWHRNDGGGGFTAAGDVAADAPGARAVAAFDLDGDGDRDALFASAPGGAGELAWSENLDGLGTFGPKQAVSAHADDATGCFAADLDGDLDLDLLASWGEANRVAWYENADGLGSFGPETVVVDSLAADARSVFAADLNGDGRGDVLYAAQDDNIVAWAPNVGPGAAFGTPRRIAPAADAPRAVAVADLDGDGDLDALSASTDDDKVQWYENVGGDGEVWDLAVLTNAADGASAVVPCDLDGDGDQDAVAGSELDDTIEWFENLDGAGAFGPGQTISLTADKLSDLAAADVDGDGDCDLLFAAPGGAGVVAWHENDDGAGAFSTAQVISAAALGASAVAAADVDGDGDLDAVSTALFGGFVGWHENTDGAGTFGSPQPINPSSYLPQTAAAADLDTDGDPDVLVSTLGDASITWYENTDGLGAFGLPQFVELGGGSAQSLGAADVDGDGDPDVVAGLTDANRVVWYANVNGLGAFAPADPVGVASGVREVCAADLDGDGAVDVLAAAPGTDDVAWFENSVCGHVVATETVRLGEPPNPDALLPGATSAPILGEVWDPRIDHTTFQPGALVDFLGISFTAVNLPSAFGTLLCDPSPPGFAVSNPLPGTPFQLNVPFVCETVGIFVCVQGGSIDATGVRFANALDVVVGTE